MIQAVSLTVEAGSPAPGAAAGLKVTDLETAVFDEGRQTAVFDQGRQTAVSEGRGGAQTDAGGGDDEWTIDDYKRENARLMG
jgi:hypothetical protein